MKVMMITDKTKSVTLTDVLHVYQLICEGDIHVHVNICTTADNYPKTLSL